MYETFYLPRSVVGLAGSLLMMGSTECPIVLDVALLDEVEADELLSGIVLCVSDTRVLIGLDDDFAMISGLVHRLRGYVRHSSIASSEVYKNLSRRLNARGDIKLRDGADFNLKIGSEYVSLVGDQVHIGTQVFATSTIAEMALKGHNISIPPDLSIQAALVQLVIAAEARPGGREDYAGIEQRVKDYKTRMSL